MPWRLRFRLCLELGLIDSEGRNLGIQGLPGNPEFRRGTEWAGDATFRLPQRHFDHLSFPVSEASVQGLRGGRRPRWLMPEPGLVDGERIAVTEDDGPLDDILQLANIARPAVGLEQIERRLLDALDLLPRTLCRALHQVFHQQGNVIGSFAQ